MKFSQGAFFMFENCLGALTDKSNTISFLPIKNVLPLRPYFKACNIHTAREICFEEEKVFKL